MVFPPGYLRVILATLIWGSVSIFVRIADQPAPVIVFVRVFTALIALSLYLRFRGQTINLKGHYRLSVLSGIALALTWLFFSKAVQATTIGNAVLTYYMAPIFSIIWAFLFLGEKIEKRALLALGVACAGISLILSNYKFSLLSGGDFLGILYCLTAALFYSLVIVIAKKLTEIEPTHLVTVQMAVSTLIFLPLVAESHPVFSLVSVSSMVLLGLVHSAFALVLYFDGIRWVKVQHASILAYIEPVSAPCYAYLLFAEIPTLHTLTGGLLILFASFLTVRSGLPAPQKHEIV
jgi:drug/metabolite transporter (DMT)-like permease